MNDRCTPATARALRGAGFPQPVPEPGQVWYIDNTPYVIRLDPQKFKENSWIFSGLLERVQAGMESLPEAVYAPTAPDILRELGEAWALSSNPRSGMWWCDAPYDEDLRFNPPFENENPAEACAMAWMAKQKANG